MAMNTSVNLMLIFILIELLLSGATTNTLSGVAVLLRLLNDIGRAGTVGNVRSQTGNVNDGQLISGIWKLGNLTVGQLNFGNDSFGNCILGSVNDHAGNLNCGMLILGSLMLPVALSIDPCRPCDNPRNRPNN